MALDHAGECVDRLAVPGNVRIADRVQRLHAAAVPDLGYPCGQLLIGKPAGRTVSGRHPWPGSNIDVGMAGSGYRHDRRGAAFDEGKPMNKELSPLGHAKDTLVDLAIRFGPKLLTAVLILTAGAFVATWVARAASRGLSRIDLEPPVRQLLTRVTRVLVLGLFLLMALQNLGVELLPLIAGLGVAGAGIALAMQGVLGNMMAGLTIIFTKPFRVGEYISIASEEGQVENVSMFTTVLSHPDRSQVIIPNRKIVGEILHNYGKIRQIE